MSFIQPDSPRRTTQETHILNKACGGACPCKPKWTSLVIACVWGMFSGVERILIMTTLWFFLLHSFSPTDAIYYYGSTLLAYSLANVFSSYLNIHLALSNGTSVYKLLIVSNILAICGNFLYFASPFAWLLMFARLLAGSAVGAGTPMYAEVVDMADPPDRGPCVIALLLSRQAGLLFGPIVALSSHLIDFDLGPFHVNVYNSPGLFMAGLWALHLVFIFFLYPGYSVPVKEHSFQMNSIINDEDAATETTMGKAQGEKKKKKTASCSACLSFINRYNCSFLLCTFASYTCVMAVEALLPPLLHSLLDWNEFHLSIVFFGCGVILIFLYPTLRLLNATCKQETLLVIGFIFLLISYSSLVLHLILFNAKDYTVMVVGLMIVIGIQVVGHPFVVMFSESLFLASLSQDLKKSGQVTQRASMNMGIVLGPLIGGCMQGWPVYAALVILGITVIVFLFTVCGLCCRKVATQDFDDDDDDSD